MAGCHLADRHLIAPVQWNAGSTELDELVDSHTPSLSAYLEPAREQLKVLTAAIPIGNPYCSCKLTAERISA